jgi:hypothetical protein
MAFCFFRGGKVLGLIFSCRRSAIQNDTQVKYGLVQHGPLVYKKALIGSLSYAGEKPWMYKKTKS